MLPSDYYLTNFELLTNFVVETYREILSAEELAWAETVAALPENARRLYVRLLSRQGTVFRLKKLKYPEIEAKAEAALRLQSAGLATLDPPEDWCDLLASLTRPELLKLPELTDIKTASRAVLDARLIELNSTPAKQALSALDEWIQIEQVEKFELFVLCYFGNPYQDLSEFVLRDLGHATFESYIIDKNTRPFQTRPQLDAHWRFFQCHALRDALDETSAEALMEVCLHLPVVDEALSADRHLVRRVDRFRNQIARQLERLQENEAALNLYRQTQSPPSRERQVRLLNANEQLSEALALLETMTAAPIDDSERRFARRELPKLQRALGRRVAKQHPFKPNTTRLTLHAPTALPVDGLPNESPAERVERIAQQYYQRSGRCYYVENALLRGVLGLFIWDLMYLPIDGAFHHPFQTGPADLMEVEFLPRRRKAYIERWQELDDPLRFGARVWQHWDDKHGIQNALVAWHHLSQELLTDALIRIPVAHWRAMFDRLLIDLRYNGKGLPDLVLFPTAGSYEFIEIKGPGDALQQHQRRWMEYFSAHGIPCRVVNISYAKLEHDA